jgi:hypothetical protein
MPIIGFTDEGRKLFPETPRGTAALYAFCQLEGVLGDDESKVLLALTRRAYRSNDLHFDASSEELWRETGVARRQVQAAMRRFDLAGAITYEGSAGQYRFYASYLEGIPALADGDDA